MISVLLCLVVAVTDGDTLKVRCGEPGNYEQKTIRLSAIDAPEKKQAFGQKSKEALRGLCFKDVASIKETATDRYGRTVADVTCKGRDVGAYMVSTGYAWVYDKYAKGYSHLYPLQDQAKAKKLGLWKDMETKNLPVPPWEWRKEHKGR